MKIRKLGRLGAVVGTASLVAMSVFAPVAAAKAPNWSASTVTQIVSGGITSGGNQGFAIHIVNSGPSNISSLYLVTNVADAAAWVSDSRCTTTGSLVCSFGAVNAYTTVDLTVAYRVPFSNGGTKITFELNTTGNVPGKNNSHGDAFDMPQTVSLLTGRDQAASYIVADATVQNDQSLDKRNPQATSVVSPAAHIPVVVEDGSGVSFTCSGCNRTQFGQWSRVSVNAGQPFDAPFKVVLLERGQSIPNVDVNTLVVYHVLDDGNVETISARCDSATAPTNVPAEGCLVPTMVGRNLQIVIWTFHNGGFRGAI